MATEKNIMETAKDTKKVLQYVIVRTSCAGVHAGELVSRNRNEVELCNARRVWAWTGAKTLHEISLFGVGDGSKISAAVARIVLLGVIEIIDATTDARAALETVGWN
jgi:hypothetical protein